MGLFGQRAPTPDQLDAYIPAPTRLRVLRADGQRIDLTGRNTGPMLAATRQGWQSTAWQYRDMIGELRYSYRLLARSTARVRFYPAEQRPRPQDPAPLDGDDHELDPQLVADALVNFARIPFDSDPDGYTARLAENFGVVGEVWVHIDADGQWTVRSTSEVTASADGRVVISSLPTAIQGSQRVVDPETEDLLRMWVPHPEWGQLADAAMRAQLDVAEDIALTGREQRAAARSRVAANGILLLPSTLSLVRARDLDDEQDDSVTSDTFMADFTAAMLAPIRDDGDAQAVVPIVIRGEREDLDGVKHLTLQRADAEKLIERQSAAILRLLRGVDVQPEQVDGLGQGNHWSSWLVSATAVKDQVQPMAETIAACHVQAFLRPALLSLGHDPVQVARVTIACDVSALVENPNRGQDARDAHAALVISDEALRQSLGFDEDDKPDEEEFIRRLASSGRLPVADAAAIFGLTPQRQARPITVQGETTAPALPAGDRAQARPGETTPERPIPAEPTRAPAPERAQIVAAAAPAELDPLDISDRTTDTCRRLAAIDAALIDGITVAADAALARVLDRAGARVRSAARRDKALAASLAGVDAHLVPSRLGRDRVESFVPILDLITDGYDRLRKQVERRLADAARTAAAEVVDLLKLEPATRAAERVRAAVQARLAARAGQVWRRLIDHLDAAAEEALFDPDSAAEWGEAATTLIRPGDVRDALDGGYATGRVVRDLLDDEGAEHVGWEWLYQPEIARAEFGPHRRLHGARVLTWTDPQLVAGADADWIGPHYYPGDHAGCRCVAAPLYRVGDTALVAAGIRRVRTPEGARRYGKPIGSPITPGGEVPKKQRAPRPTLRPITEADRARLAERKIVPPPGWTDVQVADDPDAPLQVVGRDAKGREQRIYSAEHAERAAAAKFDRINRLDDHIEGLDNALARDAATNDAAAALTVIRAHGLRPGSDTDTGADKEAFGATNLRTEHVVDDGDDLRLMFTGKKGVALDLPITDPEAAAALRSRVAGKLPGERVFATDERRVREYMAQAAPGFTPKDLRTYHGTATAEQAIEQMPAPTTEREFSAARREVGRIVSEQLGNTPTVALASYIDPAVFGPWDASLRRGSG